ncbi:MAG TPA: hypothetical protein VI112_05090 [Bacteroidia bacterium]|jgi:hypothetical protein
MDALLILTMYIAPATPALWLILFFMLRDREGGKTSFWISFIIYLLIAGVFLLLLADASGWDGLGILVIGAICITVYTLLLFFVFLLIRNRMPPLEMQAKSNSNVLDDIP